MTTHPLYHELFRHITHQLPHVSYRVRVRVVWWVCSILLAETVVCSRIASRLFTRASSSIQIESYERHLRRILADGRLSARQVYAPVVQAVVQWSRVAQVEILLDESGHSDVERVLTAALYYRGRALPLAWVAWPAQQPFGTAQGYWRYVEQVLTQVQAIVPAGVAVVVIADRAFGHPGFTDQVAARGWFWVVRLQRQTRLRDAQGQRAVVTCVPQVGQHWYGHGHIFKKQGWRWATLAGCWRAGHHDPLIVASNLPAPAGLLVRYQQRFAIECLFRDWKSAGFGWEQSQVRQHAHLEVVLLGLAWATLVVLCAGEQVAEAYLAQPASGRTSLPRIGKRSLVTLGRERIAARAAQTMTTPLTWQLRHLDAPGWRTQVTLHLATARLVTMGEEHLP